MITRGELDRARIHEVSMWGHWSSQHQAEDNKYQNRGGCLDAYFSGIAGAIADKDESWTMFHMTQGCWDYRRPYVEEIIEMFAPLFGGEVYIHDNPSYGPRVVYRLQRGMAKEPVHAFNVFLRYSWLKLHQWPIQECGPDAKSVWQSHLDYTNWDANGKPMYVSASNFCGPSNFSKAAGFSSADYVDIMYDIMSEGMQEFPYDSRSKVPQSGAVTMKSHVFKMALARYLETHEIPEYDPFE